MKVTFSASVDVIDVEKYMAAVRVEMQRVFYKAGQKFLLAAIPKIPIWTGMARGAFRNLEDLVGKVTNDAQSATGVRIRTTQGKKNKATGESGTAGRGGGNVAANYRRGYYYTPPGGSRIERTPQSGRQFATATDKILELTGATLASGRSAFYFRFDVDITYFTHFDESKWGAFRAGSAALESYIKDNLNLPSPLEFTTRKTITAK